MSEPQVNPILGRKLTPRYLAVLVAVALSILVVGSLLRPRKPAAEAPAPPPQSEVRRLQGLAERGSLDAMARHFAGVALDVAAGLVRIEPGSRCGIAWSADLVVAPGQDGPSPEAATVVAPGGAQLSASRVVGGPDLPLSAYEPAGPLQPAPRWQGGGQELVPGQWIVAVWRGEAGPAFAPGHYVETRPVECEEFAAHEVASSLALSEPMAGGGLFDLDEALVAVVLPCGGRYVAMSLESVSRALAEGRGFEAQLRARYGLSVDPLDPALRKHLGAGAGALVSQVWSGFAADAAGLRPGDVIVDMAGKPVAGPEDLRPLVSTQPQETALEVWRAARRTELRLGASAAAPASPKGDPAPKLKLAQPAEGFPIGVVAPDGPAARAGIRAGDRLLRVDFVEPHTPSEARRALARKGQPVFLEIQRGTRRFGVLIG